MLHHHSATQANEHKIGMDMRLEVARAWALQSGFVAQIRILT